ncbi:beta-xylosidase [Lentzea aerocolonigenes]|uniref:Beta-xylosidase n=1 Tax=Lentzea aerocolonigenes TaxID=68170 RepID=A0A0F0H494_LENAE|nr:beta-xylosidase [Lentzea aerocolonigenes]KJK50335.1 beta-xylosidase [Lentzea aerocolonigenes]
MPLSRRPPALLAALALLGAVTACTSTAVGDPTGSPTNQHSPTSEHVPEPPPPQQRNYLKLTAENGRESPGTVVTGVEDAVYNYAPAVMLENGKVRTWWCSQMGSAKPNGDDILYSEGPSLDGPFSTARAVLSGSGGSFDAMHTCDPSLIKIGDTYYLYYTGASRDNHANGSSVGVATSKDGTNWTRANGGQTILGPAGDIVRENAYGAGQQSAIYLDGWIYLLFTDTTGYAAASNGAGQYVLRSKDPVFTTGVEALTPQGFKPVEGTNKARTRSVVEAYSSDWMWIEAASAFAIAHETETGTTITFWNKEFTRHPYEAVVIPGPWTEGPGLVRTPEGHAPINTADPCERVSIDVLRSTAKDGSGAPTNIRHFGIDALGLDGCATAEEAKVLNGFSMPSPERTADVVVGGKIVRFERGSVAAKYASGMLARRPKIADSLKVAVRVPAGVPAVRSPSRQLGLLVNNKLMIMNALEAAELNSSEVTLVSQEEWDRFERLTT